MRSIAREETAVAVLGHPLGSGHMALEGAPGTLWFIRGIDVQNNTRHFGPICPIGFSVKKTQIGDEMFVVVILALRMCLMARGATAQRDGACSFLTDQIL